MSDSVRAEDLAKAELLKVLPPEALEELASHAELRSYKSLEVIFEEGAPGESLHVILSGLIKVVHRKDGHETSLTTLGPGRTFGELAVLDPAPRSATVIAIDPSTTVELHRDHLEAVLDQDPSASRRMLGQLARSLTLAREDLAHQNQILDVKVQERTAELQETQLEVIRRLGMAAEFRDDDTGLHISRMSRFCHRLALAAGFNENESKLLLQAAPMHDIGKIGIPDSVLLKPGKLEPEEWEIMKTHPLLGAELLDKAKSQVMRLARGIALAHHEKWDGSGYPQGLKQEDIPIMARICTISDVFDALISERPYKKPWSVDDALELIQKQAGRDFDPNLAEIFISIEDQLREILAHQVEMFSETGTA